MPASPFSSNVPSSLTVAAAPPATIGFSGSVGVAITRTGAFAGFGPSNETRPTAVPPLLVVTMRFSMSSPATLTGAEPDSLPPAIAAARNIITLSPCVEEKTCIARACST